MEFVTLLRDGHARVLPPWMFVKPGYGKASPLCRLGGSVHENKACQLGSRRKFP